MGKCKILCDLCVWVSGLVAAWLDLGSWRERFCSPGWILAAPGLHSELFVSLGGKSEATGACQSEKLKEMQKNKTTSKLN